MIWNAAVRICAGLALCLLLAQIMLAQENQTESQGQESETEEAAKAKANALRQSEGPKSLANQAFFNARNRLGFSLGTYELYSNNLLNTEPGQHGAVTSLLPRFYLNFGKRKAHLHLDYGFGYRLYHNHRDLDAVQHAGSFLFDYAFSRTASFRVHDQITVAPNDSGLFAFPGEAPILPVSGFSSEVLLTRQRILTNTLLAELNFQPWENGHLGLFSSYNIYRYDMNASANADPIQAGVIYDHRLTKWFSLSNTFSTYLNSVDSKFRMWKIHRLQAGGLNFHLDRNWHIFASGGGELAELDANNYFTASINTGIAHTSPKNSLSVAYQRGFTQAVGISQLSLSHIVTARLVQRMTRRLDFQMSGSYWRGSGVTKEGLLRSYSAGAGFEIIIRPDLVASVNYTYQNQRAPSLAASDILGINRYVASCGLQYIFPSRRR